MLITDNIAGYGEAKAQSGWLKNKNKGAASTCIRHAIQGTERVIH